MRHISSRDNPQFKALRALVDDPRSHGRALVDGIHLVSTCLACGIGIMQLLVSESGQNNAEISALLQSTAEVDGMVLRDSLFRELSGVSTPTGIAAVIDAGACALEPTTVVDLTGGEPELIRQGRGDPAALGL